MIKFYNTMSGKKDEFIPIEEGKVKISVGSNPDLPLSAFIETQTEVKNI
jgi:hypothetical protein